MQYRTLAETYEELNATMSKLAKAEIVAKLLKKTPSDEIEKVTLLLSGRIFPEWSDQKIGVAEKLVIKAIAKATGSSVDNIVKEFKKTGDLGFTAENLIEKKKQLTLDQLDLTVKLVFENLTNLAQQEGSGSQEKKLDLISELLSAAEPLEACAISSPGYAKKAAASVNNRCLSRSSKNCTIENSCSVQWAGASGRALRHSETFGSVHSTCCQWPLIGYTWISLRPCATLPF